MITYKKMSLFDTPEGSILVHACNAQGVWGSGIAATFKAIYPRSFKEYHNYCMEGLKKDPEFGRVGTAYVTNQENKRHVGCLITSFSYGKDRDSVEDIVAQTFLALDSLFKDRNFDGYTVYSNKFNSGMFKVDWRYTEKVLTYFIKRYNLNWVVCDPD